MAYGRIQRCKACLLSYQIIEITVLHIFLSVLVCVAFGAMFFKMSMKHTKRIKGYREEFRPVWHFFDKKSYLIMAVMMGEVSGFVHLELRRMYLLLYFIQDLD